VADNHPECLGYGLCASSRKQIIINPGQQSLDVTMIHEIAHAVAQLGHGLRWQQRMEKAAQKADSIGRGELAAALREDYTAYSDPDRCWIIPAIAVYKQIEDAVFETRGERSFEEIVAFVANSVGLASSQLLT
jgi:hypothetical protein